MGISIVGCAGENDDIVSKDLTNTSSSTIQTQEDSSSSEEEPPISSSSSYSEEIYDEAKFFVVAPNQFNDSVGANEVALYSFSCRR